MVAISSSTMAEECIYLSLWLWSKKTWVQVLIVKACWYMFLDWFSSVQFSCSVMSDCLQPYGLQHARLPCPSPTSGARSNSCPLSRWCHPTISSTVVPFSSHLQSFPASGSFSKSQFFASGGQSIDVSASTSVLLVNIQDWLPLGWVYLDLPKFLRSNTGLPRWR